jgi:hypothetical protein
MYSRGSFSGSKIVFTLFLASDSVSDSLVGFCGSSNPTA